MARPADEHGAKNMLLKIYGPPINNKLVQRLKDYATKYNIFPDKYVVRDTSHLPSASGYSGTIEINQNN